MLPYSPARTDFSFPAGVVRDEETEAGIRHEMHIAMEVNRVAAVPENAVTVARFFVETETHSVQRRVESELAGVHQPRGFRTQNLRALKLSVLQLSNHEAREI